MARIRTFIAVALEESVRNRVQALQQKLARDGGDVKWVEEENLHITLLFLGEVAELDVVPICRIVTEAVEEIPSFNLEIAGLGAFPNSRRPKTLWAGIGEGAESLKLIHDALEAPLLELGCYRREERAYTPHLTLGRVNREDSAGAWGSIIAKHTTWQGGDCAVDEVLVMSSELNRSGPVYSVMARAQLAD
jgi:2'-5' RNA ligase